MSLHILTIEKNLYRFSNIEHEILRISDLPNELRRFTLPQMLERWYNKMDKQALLTRSKFVVIDVSTISNGVGVLITYCYALEKLDLASITKEINFLKYVSGCTLSKNTKEALHKIIKKWFPADYDTVNVEDFLQAATKEKIIDVHLIGKNLMKYIVNHFKEVFDYDII